MTKPPLVSSKQASAALERLGFLPRGDAHGSHQVYVRSRAGGGHDVIVVPLGKGEIARWTLKAMLRTGNVTLDEFMKGL